MAHTKHLSLPCVIFVIAKTIAVQNAQVCDQIVTVIYVSMVSNVYAVGEDFEQTLKEQKG